MKHVIYLCAVVFLMASCGKKKESKNIIVSKKQETRAPAKKEKMEPVDYTWNVEWGGSTYTVLVHRFPDESLPMVEDEYGNKYYDNRITIKVTRKDGSEFFNKTFTKNDFSHCLDDNFRKNGALLGLIFVESVGDDLKFGGSVGSPDPLSDEYIPLVMKLNRMGTIHVYRDAELDGSAPSSPNDVGDSFDDDGV